MRVVRIIQLYFFFPVRFSILH